MCESYHLDLTRILNALSVVAMTGLGKTCLLAILTYSSFRIFNSNPLRQIHWERLGPVVAVEMLFRTNYLAIVGGGYPLNNGLSAINVRRENFLCLIIRENSSSSVFLPERQLYHTIHHCHIFYLCSL